MHVEGCQRRPEAVLISAEELQARLAQLAAQVDADYRDKDLLIVGVLKGAVMVVADFIRALKIPVEMDWMAVSSYGSSTKSSGVVRILKDLDADLSGRHVLIVEDILDSGLTLSWLLRNLRSRGRQRRGADPSAQTGRHAHRGGCAVPRFRHPQRLRGRIRPGLRREVPEPRLRRETLAVGVRGPRVGEESVSRDRGGAGRSRAAFWSTEVGVVCSRWVRCPRSAGRISNAGAVVQRV